MLSCQNRRRILTTKPLKAFSAPTPTPLVSLLIPPLPKPVSSIIFVCRLGVFAFRLLSFICRLYDALNKGRKLHSCFMRPVRMVVRAREFTAGGADMDDKEPEAFEAGSFLGRSATTI